MQWTGAAAATLAELGEIELATNTLCHVPWPPRRNQTYPETAHSKRTLLATQALLALTRLALGELAAADRLLAWLAKQQLPAGALPGTVGRGMAGAARVADAWSTACYLRACRAQVAAHFARHGHLLPQDISPHDGRMQCVLAWARGLGPEARIAEVGCGPGRFLAQLRAAMPSARLVGIDPDARFIAQLPAEIEGRTGDLLRIPARPGEFDGVLAIESLEHCLLPEQAVQELCRVVRPGGHVLVIDKHAAHQPLSHHQPWERWFWPQELAAWFAALGCHVETHAIAHGRHARPTGLFIAWHATRAVAANRAASMYQGELLGGVSSDPRICRRVA